MFQMCPNPDQAKAVVLAHFRERRTSPCLLFILLELFVTTVLFTGSDSPGKEDKKPRSTIQEKYSAGNYPPNLRLTVHLKPYSYSGPSGFPNYREELSFFLNAVSAFVTSNQHKIIQKPSCDL